MKEFDELGDRQAGGLQDRFEGFRPQNSLPWTETVTR